MKSYFKEIRFLCEAALIAALYAAITVAVPFSSGPFQIRVSEALTILPFFTPAAIPGLFIGCITANLVVGAGPFDVIFGSLATLLAAFVTYRMPKKFLAPLPPVVINAVVVPAVLMFTINAPFVITMGWVTLGEIIACCGLGYPLMLLLEKNRGRLFNKAWHK